MRFYMEILVLGVIRHSFCFFKLFPIGCIGLITFSCILYTSLYFLSRVVPVFQLMLMQNGVATLSKHRHTT